MGEKIRKTEVDEATWAVKVAALESAYQEWKSLPEKDAAPKIPFGETWLEDNGYSGLCYWARARGGMNIVIARVSSELQDAFFGHISYSRE